MNNNNIKKLKTVAGKLKKASKAHAGQAKTLRAIVNAKKKSKKRR